MRIFIDTNDLIPVMAQISLSQMTYQYMPKEQIDDRIKQELAHALAEEILKSGNVKIDYKYNANTDQHVYKTEIHIYAKKDENSEDK